MNFSIILSTCFSSIWSWKYFLTDQNDFFNIFNSYYLSLLFATDPETQYIDEEEEEEDFADELFCVACNKAFKNEKT